MNKTPICFSRLEAKVAGQNMVNAARNEWAPKLAEVAARFVGLKVELAAGGITDKFRKALAALGMPRDPSGSNVHAWVNTSRYTVCVTFKVCLGYTYPWHGETRESCHYSETDLSFADVEGGILVRVCDTSMPARVDYTAEEVCAARRALVDAKRAVSLAQSALGDFGEYDNN